MESSGCYDDYSNDVMFLVETESDAKDICQYYNDYVKFLTSVDTKVREFRIKWEIENPNIFTANIQKRHAQVKAFLKLPFKKEIEDKLIEELNELAAQRKASDKWHQQSWEATKEFKETIMTPNRFKNIGRAMASDAQYSYFVMDVSKKEDVL